MADDPSTILDLAWQRALTSGKTPLISDQTLYEQIELVAHSLQNRACARFILACSLAQTHQPHIDIRKPYTEIGDNDAYSGRTYDERYIQHFVTQNELPCNSTTAFLTPAFRNRNAVLTPDLNLVGRPPAIYAAALYLLDAVHQGHLSAADLLAETIRWLLVIRDAKRERIRSLLTEIKAGQAQTVLSAEGIVSLIEQHFSLRHSSRLPVLAIAAIYQAAQDYLGERVLPLESHNAADRQTGALGDLEIILVDDAQVVTSYEVKTSG
ncbi:hypothetical protein EH222_08675 [candidate division KSB1 bacterium]|nr:MAG: hypothetical protein EH222_08675 [candidate division KSB1 bacterium]